ncbi:MAG: hypothetical protein ING59_12195 [Burkholderiales bacterium]|nr:hypothetical protein [Burkholderiales bacterium]
MFIAVVAMSVAVSFALTACDGGSSSAPPSGPTPTPTPPSPPPPPSLPPPPPAAAPDLALLGASAEGAVEEVARAIDFDGSGDVYVVGSMAPGAQLRTSAGGASLTVAGNAGTDAFVAYLDAAGVPQWILSLSEPGTEYAYDVVADGADRAWVCGTFSSSLVTPAGTLTAVAVGVNGFAARVTRTGSVERLLHISPAAGLIPGQCATDSNGRLYVTGSYLGAPTVIGTALPEPPARATGGFVAAYAADGTARLARGFAGSAGVAWRSVVIRPRTYSPSVSSAAALPSAAPRSSRRQAPVRPGLRALPAPTAACSGRWRRWVSPRGVV